ncbi:hypothetical protein MAPG_10597 [Magnaporthiopsis poae ATCC 64411]|uniref:PD-(D/E)XK nuclease-like domain-containing protein n=1 Tax=Magnaporthiopsis poae (strain ATCC 64411 / 73-15) TaxID=644358 RepID=A0A0C4ED06_MAGP6|nr:hypothetical protein MAPG_10597 [Magnaporthiopsis poae ATCC 64411]
MAGMGNLFNCRSPASIPSHRRSPTPAKQDHPSTLAFYPHPHHRRLMQDRMSPSFCTELADLYQAVVGWLEDVPLDPACFQHQEQPLTATVLDPAAAWSEGPSDPSSPPQPPSSSGEPSHAGGKRKKAPTSHHSDSAGPQNNNSNSNNNNNNNDNNNNNNNTNNGNVGQSEMPAENPVIVQLEQLTSEMQLPEDVRHMFFNLVTICNGSLVLARSVGEAINARMAIVDPYGFTLSSRTFIEDPTDEAELRSQLAMVGKISAIVRESGMASDRYASEAEWNEWVHRPMLRLGLMAAESARERLTPDPLYLGVDMFNTKEALITPICLPVGLDEHSVPDKMINYCIVLSDRAMEAACDTVIHIETERRMRRDDDDDDDDGDHAAAGAAEEGGSISIDSSISNMIKKHPRAPYAINHSEYWPLVGRPLCISVETHAETGTGVEELEHVPLALWSSAHFVRLRQLQGLVDDPTARDNTLPSLPLLCLVGEDWYVLFAVDRGSYMSLLRFPQPIGSTGSIVGCYKILAMVRMLRAWCWNQHRLWWEKLLRDICGLPGEAPGEEPGVPVEERGDNEAEAVAAA